MQNDIGTIPFHLIDGKESTLAAYGGKVVLVVNVASKCGLTPQYEGLEQLFEDKRDAGLVVIGFPANNFGEQEPGSNEEIAQFCTMNFGVAFPIAEKLSVKGADQHPLYGALTRISPQATDPANGAMRTKLENYGIKSGDPSDVLWNFEKFLIGRDGKVAARFNPDVAPNDPVLLDAIQRELDKPAAA
jgi:glutathione peroxidase